MDVLIMVPKNASRRVAYYLETVSNISSTKIDF